MRNSILSALIVLMLSLTTATLALAQAGPSGEVQPGAAASEAPSPGASDATGDWMRRGQTGPVARVPIGPKIAELTVQECRNLGCTVREAANCPAITHDYGFRNWACQCAGGSSCINESSPN